MIKFYLLMLSIYSNIKLVIIVYQLTSFCFFKKKNLNNRFLIISKLKNLNKLTKLIKLIFNQEIYK